MSFGSSVGATSSGKDIINWIWDFLRNSFMHLRSALVIENFSDKGCQNKKKLCLNSEVRGHANQKQLSESVRKGNTVPQHGKGMATGKVL